MSRKENIEKNMEFLIKELQKEWDVSKETKHRVTISAKDARRVRIRVQQQIADMGEMLHSQSNMSFKESMKLCRANYVTLRVARKLIAGQNAGQPQEKRNIRLPLTKKSSVVSASLRQSKGGCLWEKNSISYMPIRLGNSRRIRSVAVS